MIPHVWRSKAGGGLRYFLVHTVLQAEGRYFRCADWMAVWCSGQRRLGQRPENQAGYDRPAWLDGSQLGVITQRLSPGVSLHGGAPRVSCPHLLHPVTISPLCLLSPLINEAVEGGD